MLAEQFTILTLAGIWCPPKWSSLWKKIIYKFYSFLVNMLMCTLGMTQIARIIFIKQSFSEFNDTFFVMLSTAFACFKAGYHIIIQKRVINLLDLFKNSCCVAQSNAEKDIKRRYDDICRKIALGLLMVVEVTALAMIVIPLNGGVGSRELIYKVLLPYNLSSPLVYWMTFAHHCFGAVFYTAISITNDSMIAGFMLQVCAQLEILQYRITELPVYVVEAYRKSESEKVAREIEKWLLGKTVQHHVHVVRIAETICKTFYEVVVGQFIISALSICVSIYQLSFGATNKIEFITYLLYVGCMLQQLFVYCYCGNEVTIQSKNISTSVFGIDWTPLSLEVKKDLATIILRSSKPIEMTCGAFFHLTLDSFTSIVKASYSVFTVLK